ncbi:MAG: tRNA lysidine(34) synthetase TilS [Planctomycetota bacterium]
MSPSPPKLPDPTLEQFRQAWPPERWKQTGVVIGCSGGSDSVALVRIMAEISRIDGPGIGFLHVAHYNHGLRGQESDADESLVRELARDCEFDLDVGLPDASIVAENDIPRDDEESLRRLRHDFFRSVGERIGARYVVTAHTADDQLETAIHHWIRGTGPVGLAGIPAHRELGADLVLVRPLLNQRRSSLRTFLTGLGQCWREDASNASPRYTRNWIRHELLPLIQQRFPSADDAMLRAVAAVGSWKSVIDEQSIRWCDARVRLSTKIPPSDSPTASKSNRNDNDACFIPASEMHVLLADTGSASTESQQKAVVIRGLQIAFDRAGWSRGKMTAAHWSMLHEWIATAGSPMPNRREVWQSQGEIQHPVLPGNLHATTDTDEDVLILSRMT